MISRSRSAPTAAAMSIERTTSANRTVTCLYSAPIGCRAWCAALAAELGRHCQLGATRPAPGVVHASIVSPLVRYRLSNRPTRCRSENLCSSKNRHQT